MRKLVLLDTGPLVASVNKRDRFHQWATQSLAQIDPPLLTCEAVIAETCHLLRRFPKGPAAILELVDKKAVQISFSAQDNVKSLRKLLGKYSDIPMSFADACLVRMSELYEGSAVMTLDRDFGIYRRCGRQTINTLMPADI